MGDAKLTPWFPGSVKPARPGVYERELSYSDSTAYWKFDGAVWVEGGWQSAQLAASHALIWKRASDNQNYRWRGLASNPKDTPQ